MTRNQINLLNMLKSVDQFFTENPTLISDKPALQAAIVKLKAYISELEALEQAQTKDAKADIALKGETRKSLIEAILKTLAGVSALGAATNDTRLKMAADVNLSDLKKMRDNDLILEAHSTYELAQPIAAQLLVWEVIQADIDALDTNTAAYDAKDPAIKNIRARSSQATKAIKAKIEEAYNFTKDSLDAMMLPFKSSNATKYGQYLNARDIIKVAGGRTKAKTGTANGTTTTPGTTT